MNKKYKNPYFIIGSIITGIIMTATIIGIFWLPYDPNAMDNASKLAGVSLKHIMGCDNFGRDVFSRVLLGSRNTLEVAVGTVAIGCICGVIIGAFTGYFGGIVDKILMRVNDALFAFPRDRKSVV